MRANGKTWVVTGGGNGMGRELVLLLLARGARVAAVDVRPESLQELVEAAGAGERLSVHVVDITDRVAVEVLVSDVESAHGAVDGLINNAGVIQPFIAIQDLDYEQIQRVLDVNLMGTIHMVKAFLPGLLERPQAHIANVSSMGGFFPFPGQSMYGASKAAVKLLTQGLYAELFETGVRVSLIMPGAIRTAITENSGVDAPEAEEDSRIPMTSAPRAAEIIVDGIERDRLHIFVGKDARFMDIAIRIAPRPAINFIRKQMAAMLSGTPARTTQ